MEATLIHSLSFGSSKKEVFFSILQVFAGSLFLALCSQVSIPLYFSPIVLSMQTFGMMFVGASLGSRKGMLSVLAYLVEGSLGLPVFACGSFGFMRLFGLSGGYFLGFLFQAYLVGWFTERQTSFQVTKTLPILLLSCLIQLGTGVIWLALFTSFKSAVTLGLYPFIFGEIIKSVAIALYLKMKHEKNLNLSR